MTRQEVQVLLEFLSRAFPHRPIENKKATVETWASVLADQDRDSIYKAAKLQARTSHLFPSIAELIAMSRLIQAKASDLLLESEAERSTPWEESGCQLCPYLSPEQTEPCKQCKF